MYDAAVTWATKAERTNYWKPFRDQPNSDVTTSPVRPGRSTPTHTRNSFSRSSALDKSNRSEEYIPYLLLIAGMSNILPSYVVLECPMTMNGNWRISGLIFGKSRSCKQSTCLQDVVNDSARVKKEDKVTSIIHSNAIDLKTLDIKPTNIFFYPPGDGSEDRTD